MLCRRSLAFLLALACSAGPVLAQDAPPNLLAGPKVDAPATIVRYGMDGRLQRVDGRPEVAAAQVLVAARGLPPEVGERVRAINAARGEAIRTLLVDELDTVREVTDLITAGDEAAAREAMRAMWERFEPGRPHAPLMDALAQAVGPEHAPRLAEMNEAYWQALVQERAGGMGDAAAADAVRDRLAFELFQYELRAAYDLTLRRYRDLLESVNEGVQPTDEQRAAIREVVLEHIKRTRLAATPQQRRDTMVEIYRVLDESRREKLYAVLLRQVVPD